MYPLSFIQHQEKPEAITMKTSMSIIFFFFVLVLPISAISLAFKSPVEACIRRNVAQSLSPSSNKSKPSPSDIIVDQFCREESRIVMYFLKLNGKFPPYYVNALCKIFVGDDKKVKEYVMQKWLKSSKKLINSLSCTSFSIKDGKPNLP